MPVLKKFVLPILLFPTFYLLPNILFSQGSIIGVVQDSMTNLTLVKASITLLDAKDSFIISDTRTNLKGFFKLKAIKNGPYLLLFTYPGYVDLFKSINLNADSLASLDLGHINLITKLHLLEDVIVKGKIGKAIVIKGDTTEYTADSFKVEKNANVEDLLKQLPGIQIDQNGHIKGQGKEVHKVLVDGEEFFGSDPLLVTRNLRADMVDKVQLFDQKSDQAIFTGIDDGVKNKTINITLKANKKHGQFGKIEATGGTHKIYGTRAMGNAFNGKEKLATYITAANNGITDLSSSDQGSYGSIAGGSGHFTGEGIPKSVSGGAHYNNSWQATIQSINADYKYNYLNTKNESQTVTQNFLPLNEVITTNAGIKTKNKTNYNQVNVATNIKLDSSSNIKIAANGKIQNETNESNAATSSLRTDQTQLNHSNRINSNSGNNKSYNASLFWTKQFKKKRRTLSLMLNMVGIKTINTGSLQSTNQFYDNNGALIEDSSQYINQLKISNFTMNQYIGNFTYTEPISRSLSAVFNYGFNKLNVNSNQNSYNQLPGINYSNIDSVYSSHYLTQQVVNNFGVNFSYSKSKLLFNFGNNIDLQSQTQNNLFLRTNFNKSYFRLAPHAKMTWNISSQKSMNFSYNGGSHLPNISQLQPIIDNTNPLFLIIGNTHLKPSFSNSYDFDYNAYNSTSEKYLNLSVSYKTENNAIISNVTTDTSNGKTIMKYLNAQGNANGSLYLNTNYSIPFIKKVKINLVMGGEIQGSKYINYINGLKNTTSNNSYALLLGLNKVKTTNYDYNISTVLGYTYQSNTQSTLNNNFWIYNNSFSSNYYMPAKFQLHVDANFYWQGKTNLFSNTFHKLICNAWFGRKFLKGENLLLKISANDILNQNTGFTRSTYNSTVYQHRYLTIGRNYSLSLTWNFNRFKNKK